MFPLFSIRRMDMFECAWSFVAASQDGSIGRDLDSSISEALSEEQKSKLDELAAAAHAASDLGEADAEADGTPAVPRGGK